MDYGWLPFTRRPERPPGCSLGRTCPALVERSRVALQDHLRNLPDRGALLDEPTSESDLSGVSFGGGQRRTPRVLAATRPELVRWWMSARSNSAMPANTVSTIFPAGEVVSAHGSARLRRPAPPSFKNSVISRNRVSSARAGRDGQPRQHRRLGTGRACASTRAGRASRPRPFPRRCAWQR